jgi:dipeptidyl aminopeptidase/acylaminoacyl peptidase
MHKIILSVVFYAFTLSVFAAETTAIPLDAFAKHAKYQSVKISPTGDYLAFGSKFEGKRVVAIMQRSPAKILHVVNFNGDDEAGSFFWVNNERLIIEMQRSSGALDRPFSTGEYFAINYNGARADNIFGYRADGGVAISPTIEIPSVMDMMWEDPDHILIQALPVNKNSSNLTNVYRLNVYNGRTKRLAKSPVKQASMIADKDLQIRYAIGTTTRGDENLVQVYHRADNDSDWQLESEFDAEDSVMTIPLGFNADDSAIYMLSDHVNGRDGIYSYGLNDKKLKPIFQHDVVDVNDYSLDSDGNLYSVTIEPDYSYTEILVPNHPIGKWYPPLHKVFKGARVNITSATRDRSLLTLYVSSDTNPGSFYLFDATKGKVEELAKAKPWLDSTKLGPTDPVAITMRDGYVNYGYISTPKGKTKNLPMVVLPHGGPHGPRDYWAYDDDVAALTSRGYAVLKVNFRGSGGYGRNHLIAGYGEWGGLMIDDMTDATKWAIQDGVADPERICIYGGSYGGYAAIQSVVREPDLYQCAIGYVGIYDMDLMFEEGDVAGRRSGQNYLKTALTDDPAKRDLFSPARHVDKIKANLFIVHGEKDERAHYSHALLLKQELDKAGKKYQWMTKPKEGHGFYKEENRLELYQGMMKFLDENIGH